MMDKFNLAWSALWSDYFMLQYQFNTGALGISVYKENAHDLKFFLENILNEPTKGYYLDDDEKDVWFELDVQKMKKITDWIIEFNDRYRKPLGMVMPDFYLGREKIEESTVHIYSNVLVDLNSYIIKNQHVDRDGVGAWALNNMMFYYNQAEIDSQSEIDK